MIKFVWNNKYRLLSLIILVFGISIYKLKNPTIYYDSQRILDYADNVKNDFDSIEKTNLFLIGIEFEKKVQFENIVQLQSIHEELNENKNIYYKKSETSEWEQWKRWALENLDFEEFRIRKIQEKTIF